MPPTKSIRLSVRGSPIAEDRAEHPVLQQRHVERADRIRAGRSSARRARAGTTRSVEIDAEDARPRRAGVVGRASPVPRPRAAGRAPAAGVVPAEIPHDPVVGQDAELLGREEHGQEPVVLLVAPMLPGFRPAAPGRPATRWPSGGARRPRRRAARCRKASSERAGIGDPPDRVPHAVGRREVVERRGRQHRPREQPSIVRPTRDR